jgi:hypothetical protein
MNEDVTNIVTGTWLTKLTTSVFITFHRPGAVKEAILSLLQINGSKMD